MSYAVVILNKYPEYAERLIQSISDTHEQMPDILVISDRHQHQFGGTCRTVQGIDPFCFARNANHGITFHDRQDIILVNDDVTIINKLTFPLLELAARKIPQSGIIAPVVDGGIGNPYQSFHNLEKLWNHNGKMPSALEIPGTSRTSMPVCFVCVYLKREMIKQVGLLDENMTGYGFEDNDYCIRARKMGWKTVLISTCHVKHGEGGPTLKRGVNWSSSFARDTIKNNSEYFLNKYKEEIEYAPVI